VGIVNPGIPKAFTWHLTTHNHLLLLGNSALLDYSDFGALDNRDKFVFTTVNTYIALFRGINIGGNNLLPMKGLMGILEELGLKNIKTYIQSGNVVFQTGKGQRDKITNEISLKILKVYGFGPKVILFNEAEFIEAINNNPFDTSDGKALHFFFMQSQPESPDLERLVAIQSKTEQFRLNKRMLYLFTPDGVGRSKLAAKIEKALGVPVTARNWNTVKKLITMVEQV